MKASNPLRLLGIAFTVVMLQMKLSASCTCQNDINCPDPEPNPPCEGKTWSSATVSCMGDGPKFFTTCQSNWQCRYTSDCPAPNNIKITSTITSCDCC